MYERFLTTKLQTGKRSVLLMGPRQVGKSTLVNLLKPDLTVNLASPVAFRDYVTHPERLEHELRGAGPETRSVFIDEVQRVPALLNLVQVMLDERPQRFRFLLSGSSARKLRRGHANLLPGRIHVHYLHPLLACELGGEFVLERALAHGTLPGIYAEPDPPTREADLRSYVDTYLREEVQAEALVRNIGGYGRLLELVAASSGRILNINALCSDAGLSYETARRYIEVLEDTLILFRVPAWSDSDRASLISHPKLFLFDLGVRNALLRRPLDRPLDDECGLLLEHLVGYELHRRLDGLWPQAGLSYYRTRHGVEVDFILEVDRELWAIEVKSGRRIDRGSLKGLSSFAERVPRLKRRIVVFLGPRKQLIDGVEVIPLQRFLEELPSQ
ncbi:MAG: ATP-binding protein [Candidatus Eisenbacteria bacterium]|uniref:ATP-binding protein n=1 Tax=Eiseniibacteriota bacterium TaxID=2212470 RepID=A0A948RR04_UNCEI|nr:ATP-binding protein [Candidatus Eisenbacteria bacterium]MBU1949777.1 ATP-binding protein [Candidatus Eisenbacteria bacterium]MBU2689418.1 ATP-binding protein [Candidatus Eisenbacteria bacterium]